jgi:hypothetical protein
MPVYCYRGEDGEPLERVFSMKDDIPRTLEVDGKTFTRDLLAEHGGFRHSPGTWPMLSDAIGVGASQVGEAYEDSVKRGVPTQFTPDGQAIFLDRSHRRDYCRAYGFYDRNAGYSDPTPRGES